MEELLLGAFLTYDELDIVDEKDIVVSVFFPEFRGGYVVLKMPCPFLSCRPRTRIA